MFTSGFPGFDPSKNIAAMPYKVGEISLFGHIEVDPILREISVAILQHCQQSAATEKLPVSFLCHC
jgi:hypothetical protein